MLFALFYFNLPLPVQFWTEALHYAVFLLICTPSLTVLNGSTAYQKLHGYSPPDVNIIRVFGCFCYPNIQDIASHKLHPRSLPCVFLALLSITRDFTVYILLMVKFSFLIMLCLLSLYFPTLVYSPFQSNHMTCLLLVT